MEVYQRTVSSKVVIGGINTKVGIGDGRMRHIDEVNNLLKIRGGAIGVDVVNGGQLDGGKERQNAPHI